MLATEPLSTYDHVVLIDDVDLPAGFLDRFLALQRTLDFTLAQPARSRGSPADHPIVLQQPCSLARRTLFVEIGPVLSVDHRGFDAASRSTSAPRWAGATRLVASPRRGLGDRDHRPTPVEYHMRQTAALYAVTESAADSATLLAAVAHRPIDDCRRVVEVHPLHGRD